MAQKQTWLKLAVGLALGLFVSTSMLGWADVLHFHNGKVVRGKVKRIAGELIEFRPSGQPMWLGSVERIQRLTLSSRQDVVETRNNHKYFGEILYIDKFKVEITTQTGRHEVPRWQVSNIVLGTPNHQPLHELMHSVQPSANAPITPSATTRIHPERPRVLDPQGQFTTPPSDPATSTLSAPVSTPSSLSSFPYIPLSPPPAANNADEAW